MLIANNNNISSNITATGEWWRVSNGIVVSKGGDFNGIMSNTFGYNGNGKPYFYGNLDLYNNSNFILWQTDIPVQPAFQAPALYPNASQDQTPLTSGNFTFFIVNPGSVPETSSIQLDFFDTSADNNGDPLVNEITLNKNSPFFQYSNIEETEYHYVITARFLDWFKLINGKSYRAVLAYYDSNNHYQSITYNWTMSLTAEQQQIEQDKTQQEINAGIHDLNEGISDLNNNIDSVNNGINDMNNFLNDDSYSQNDIVNNMPTIEFPDDIQAETMLNQLFDSFRNAFTNENSQDFVFVIPNSNGQSIEIPADYIESHLPVAIVSLIRVFYWGFICLYILKDVWHYVDRLRQGDHFLESERDIKTEVL